MTEESTDAGAPDAEPVPAASYPWMYQPGQEPQVPEVPEVPDAAPPAPRRWRRRLAVLMVALLALGALGGGIAAAIDQHNEHVKQQRIAAEKKLADAYVAAVRPLSSRVFAAVQPIQDSLDGWAHLRPGLWDATKDVVQKSGATAELVAVRKALAARPAPRTHRAAAATLLSAAKDLTSAVQGLDAAIRASEKSSSLCGVCLAQDSLTAAETTWSAGLDALSATPRMSFPFPNGGGRHSKVVPTRGGFIFAADLACAEGEEQLFLLPDRKGSDEAKNLPATAKILLSTVTSLRKVRAPAAGRAVHQRLDIELQSITSMAATMNKMYAAYISRSYQAYKAALVRWDLEVKALGALDSTYTSLGVSACARFFATSEEKNSKDQLTA